MGKLTMDIDGHVVSVETETEPSPEQVEAIVQDIRKGWRQEGRQLEMQKSGLPLALATGRGLPQSPEEAREGVRNGDTNLISTLARIGGGVGGALLGLGVGGPPGAIYGGMAGSGLGDIIGQAEEIKRGQREEFNPLRTALEIGIGAIPGGGKLASTGGALARGAAFGAATVGAESLVERGELPDGADVLFASATAGLLNATSAKVAHKFLTKQFREIGQEDELFDEAMDAGKQLRLPGIVDAVDEEERLVQAFTGADNRPPAPTRRLKPERIIQEELDLGIDYKALKAAERRAVKAQERAELIAQNKALGKGVPTQQRAKFKGDITSTERLGRFVPQLDRFARIQERTGVTTYEDAVRLNDKYHLHQNFVDKFAGTLRSIFKGTNETKRAAYTAWLEAPNKLAVEDHFKFSRQDKINVRKLRGFYNRMFSEFGLDSERFLTEYSPRLRQFNSLDEAFPQGLPREIKFFADFMRGPDSTIDIREMDALVNATKYLRDGSFERHLGKDYELMRLKYVGLPDPANPSRRIGGMRDETVKEPFAQFLGAMRYNPSPTMKQLSITLNRLNDRFGKATGVRLPQADTEKFLDELLALQYGGLLGFRPSSAIRNGMQPIQTGVPLLGWKHFVKGFRQAMTAEGRELATKNGALRGDIANIQALRTIPLGKGRRALHAFNNLSLTPFQKVENVSRAWMYLGGRQKALDAFKEANGNVERFVDLADIDRFAPPIQRDILKQLETGGVEAAADRLGKALVGSTMFGYAMTERPQVLTTAGGRFAGSFGTWAASYGSYLANNLGPSAYGPKWKVRRDRMRFVAANAALLGSFSLAGYAAGDRNSLADNMAWTGLGPLFFSGGPMLDLTMSSGRAATELTGSIPTAAILATRAALEGEDIGAVLGEAVQEDVIPTRGTREFLKNARNYIPGSQAIEDFRKARKDEDPLVGAARLLGLRRGAK